MNETHFSRGSYNYGQSEKDPELQKRILEIIRDYNNGIPADVISVELETPPTTIRDNLLVLELNKKVFRNPEHTGRRGRPIILWDLIENKKEEI